ncbi:Deacylase [Methylacidimicrobium sp. AP8]|uniref:M14 family metallopeptidase n=1 Tax=Methylacidimicrobium sp. AP8 TaxID=2730359 RepID=UPI0018BFC833|nr:M14 family metallocarboxypeptidase [Methylacidimicrobium sp. AP8]CAB4243336.1 Deacylase [Methylacidimicrobium sp. AP8]
MIHAVHDPACIHRRAIALGRLLGWRRTILLRIGNDPVEVLCSRELGGRKGRPHVFLSAGIHGDEPAGVEALLSYFEQKPRWVSEFSFTVVPLLNPWGLRHNSRLNEQGLDLNRSFHRSDLPLIRELHALYDRRGPFDLALLLHEDYDACGIYLYETGRSGEAGFGEEILSRVSSWCPVDPRDRIEGRKHRNGILTRPLRKKWLEKIGLPEAAYLHFQGCRRVFTIETPSEFDVGLRVKAHMEAIDAALALLAAGRLPSGDGRPRRVSSRRSQDVMSARAPLPSTSPAPNGESRSGRSHSA